MKRFHRITLESWVVAAKAVDQLQKRELKTGGNQVMR